MQPLMDIHFKPCLKILEKDINGRTTKIVKKVYSRGQYLKCLVFFTTYEKVQKATVFAPGKPSQDCLIFASKSRAYLSEAPFR